MLEVIDDVQRHYSVDPNRVVLGVVIDASVRRGRQDEVHGAWGDALAEAHGIDSLAALLDWTYASDCDLAALAPLFLDAAEADDWVASSTLLRSSACCLRRSSCRAYSAAIPPSITTNAPKSSR